MTRVKILVWVAQSSFVVVMMVDDSFVVLVMVSGTSYARPPKINVSPEEITKITSVLS